MRAKNFAYFFAYFFVPIMAALLLAPRVSAATQADAKPSAANVAATLTTPFPPAAHYMWRRYYNKAHTCPTYSAASPAYNAVAAKLPVTECLGIIMRFTSLKVETSGGWIPEAKSAVGAQPSGGGVSAIFVRTDAKFDTKLWGGDSHGFTLYPNQGKYAMPTQVMTSKGAVTKKPITIICAYPFDGGTDGRYDRGCGKAADPQYGGVGACPVQTADAWRPTYIQGGMMGQCSFMMGGPNDSATYYEVLKGMDPGMMGDSLKNVTWQENELRLATWGTDAQSSAELPIESFFYLKDTSDGLAGAQDDQLKYYTLTGQFVPIVQVSQPASLHGEFQFQYHSADQNKQVPVPASFTRLPCTPGDFEPARWNFDGTDAECSIGDTK